MERRNFTYLTPRPRVKKPLRVRIWKFYKKAPVFFAWIICSAILGGYCFHVRGWISVFAAYCLLAIPFFLIGCFRFGTKLEFESKDAEKLFLAIMMKK